MNLKLYGFYDGMGAATTLIALAIMFLAGFLLSRISKLFRLPNVTGYILSGILIGPFLLDLVPPDVISGMSFLSDLALGFIAFGVGKFFKKDVLKKSGPRVIVITILEALVAGILVTLAVGALFPDLGWGFALLLGAIATATAPASTLMTINQYEAKGEFVDVLLQVVALDDVVCLLCFSAASAVVEGTSSGNLDALSIFMPILYNLLFLVIGFVSGLFLSFLVKGRSPNSRLIIAVAIIALISGGAILLDVSPLLSCMVYHAPLLRHERRQHGFLLLHDHRAGRGRLLPGPDGREIPRGLRRLRPHEDDQEDEELPRPRLGSPSGGGHRPRLPRPADASGLDGRHLPLHHPLLLGSL